MFQEQTSGVSENWKAVSKARAFRLTAAAAVALMVASCDSPNHSEPQGSGAAVVNVSASALSAADITRLVVVVSGQSISPDIVVELSEEPDNSWSGLIADIPAGTNRSFQAEAFDGDDLLIYSGTTTGVTIGDGETAATAIYLQQVNAPAPFDNAVPVITGFTVSPMSTEPGGDVTLTIEAMDPNLEDTLTFLWEADEGGFSNTDTASTIWTAPLTVGVYTVTVSVSDPLSSTSTASAEISVTGSGNASVSINVNTSPEVLGLVPSPTRIDENESTQIDLTVVDSESDPLSFAWSADCNGTFNDNAVEDPIFTLDTLNDDACTLTVIVTDSAGGSGQASITIETGAPVTPVDPESPSCNGIITFPDPALETTVRNAIDKPTGDIYAEDVEGITEMASSNDVPITDLTSIQCLTNLGYLLLDDNQISDLSPLSTLTNLWVLSLGSNNITDISALSSLTNLEHLWLSHNDISDISALSALTNLGNLYADYTNISDLSPLSGLNNLVRIGLYHNNISDISPLSGLTGLRTLSLGANNISDVSPLSGLINLSNLQLTSNNISDISGLAALTNLGDLSLDENNVSDITVLSGLVGLYSVRLDANDITDITPLVLNSGLDTFDSVFVRDNPLDCDDPITQSNIAALEDRGVSVYHDCE